VSWVFDDGGRAQAGFRGSTGDCVTRAGAIASGRPYKEVYDLVNELGRAETPRDGRGRSSARKGTSKRTTRKLMEALGGTWVPVMKIGLGCTMHLRADELPSGVIVARLTRHLSAVIDGVVHDTFDPSRDGTRCVYGYWEFPYDAAAWWRPVLRRP